MAEKKVIGKLNHVVLAVKDLEKAEAFFSKLFDVKFQLMGEHEGVGFKSIYAENDLELIAPTRQDSDVAKFIEKKGEGVYAVGFRVPDAGKAKEKAEAMGIRVVGDFSSADLVGGNITTTEGREIWLHPKDCFGMYLLLPQYTDS